MPRKFKHLRFLTIPIIFFNHASFSQSAYTINGKLLDRDDKLLKQNHIVLGTNSANGLQIVKESTTDSLGNFKFSIEKDRIGTGLYQIITLGDSDYKNKFFYEFKIVDGNYNYNLGTIRVMPAPINLEEVKIISGKKLYDRKLDKLIVNIENSILASGNSLSDILGKMPGIKVDQSGGISVNGKEGVLILIDGKGHYVQKEQVQVLLSTIRSENIKQLEIISNPSARYDANQGSVINIITKKDYAHSDVHLTYGSFLFPVKNISGLAYPALSLGTNLNYKTGKLSSNISINYQTNKEYRNSTVQEDYLPNIKVLKRDSSLSIYNEKRLDTHLSLSYDLSKRSFLNVDFFLIKNFQKKYESSDGINFFSNVIVPDSSIKSQGTNSFKNFYTYSLNFQYSLNLDTSNNKHIDLFYEQTNFHNPSRLTTEYNKFNNEQLAQLYNFNTERLYKIIFNSFSADYNQNLGPSVKLLAGLRYTAISTMDTTNATSSTGNINNQLSKGRFKYQEDIFGSYLMLSLKLKSFEGQAGLRSEYTSSNGVLNNQTEIVSQSYNNLFPSLSILSNLNENNKITFSYNRRIIRVSFNNLNPIANYVTPFVISKGSPGLAPQFIDYYELSYQFKELYISTTFSNGKNSRIDIPSATENAAVITNVFQNIKRIKTTDINAEYPVNVTNWWSVANNATISFNKSYLTNQNISNCSYSVSTDHNFILNPTLSLEISATYNSKYKDYYSSYNKIYSIDLGLKKSLFNKKVDLIINTSDILGTDKFRYSSSYPNDFMSFQSLKNRRAWNITLKYNFQSGASFSGKKTNSKGEFGEKRF
jgi:hypothetical protein